jgi:OmcA/MtrC family decaheme c-type cytochrome
MLAFGISGATPVERRVVVDNAKCEACHYKLEGHGGSRRGAQYCALCHNPNNPNDERVARVEGSSGVLVESTDFRVMIHKIHAGENLSQSYILGGNPAPSAGDPDGNPINFGEVRYPRSITDCSACHEDGTTAMPFGEDLLPSVLQVRSCNEVAGTDADAFCTGAAWLLDETISILPEAAVCSSCHDAPSTLAHAEIMTTDDGAESCATCHGPGSELDVSVVHAR